MTQILGSVSLRILRKQKTTTTIELRTKAIFLLYIIITMTLLNFMNLFIYFYSLKRISFRGARVVLRVSTKRDTFSFTRIIKKRDPFWSKHKILLLIKS